MRLWLLLVLPWLVLCKKKLMRLTDGKPNSKAKEKAFQATVKDARVLVALFNSYRASCTDCPRVEEALLEVSKRLKRRGVICATVDGDLAVNEKIKVENNVTSLPMMVLFRQGEALNTQGGYQTVGNIETWVQTTAGPEVEVFETQAAFDKALKARERHEAVFAAIGGPKLKELLDVVAVKGHMDGWGTRLRYFFWSDGGKGRPFAAVYRGLNEMEHFDVSGQISTETIEEFLKEEHVPVFSQVTGQDFHSMFGGAGTKGNVFVCFDPAKFEEQVKKYTRVFQKSGKKWRDYGFSYFDASDAFSKIISIECTEYPTVTLKPLRKPFKSYTKSFAQLGDALTEKHINAFMKQSIASHRSEGGEL